MRRREIVTGTAGLLAALGLAGCTTLQREPTDERSPTVNEIRFRNYDDQSHEARVWFEADGETLFSHTASLPASTGDDGSTAAVRPDVPHANWTMHASLAGSDRVRSIWQARIEYPTADVLCRITPDGRLDVRVTNGEQ